MSRLPAELSFLSPYVYSHPDVALFVTPLQWFALLERWPSVYMGEQTITIHPQWWEKLLFRTTRQYQMKIAQSVIDEIRCEMIVRESVMLNGRWRKVTIQQ